MSWKDPPRQGEVVECGQNLAPLCPTPHLKFTPWGELHQWWEAKSEGAGYCVTTVGRWLPVPKD